MKTNQEMKLIINANIRKIQETKEENKTKFVTEKEMDEVRKNREMFIKRIEAIF